MKDLDADRQLFENTSNLITLNYDLVECMIPNKLKKEFKSKILPRDYVRKDLLPLLVRCKKLGIEGAQEQIKLIIAARIGFRGFGERCEKLGRLPEEIYAEFTRGLFFDESSQQI